jgi:hypothetical protein
MSRQTNQNKPRRDEERPTIRELSFDFVFSYPQSLGQIPMLDEIGQPDGKFMCVKDGMVLNPQSYLKHIKTKKHLGYKLEIFECPACSMTCVPKFSTPARLIIDIVVVIRYTRLDACKRHYGGKCRKAAAGGPPPSFSARPASVSSCVVAPALVFTMAFTTPVMSVPQHVHIAPPENCITQPCGTPTVIDPIHCLPQSSETAINAEATEGGEDDEDPDFWEVNEIQDLHEM